MPSLIRRLGGECKTILVLWELRKTPHAHPDPGQGRRLLAWACHDPLAHQSPLTSSLREGAGLGDLPTLTLNDYECR